MTVARQDIITEEEGVYHCISRCVRRAYLCGYDVLTGKNFDHRKEWLRARLIYLSNIFCIDVLAYALMSNHQHLMLRTRPDIISTLSDKEVARRWLLLYPPCDPSNEAGLSNAIKDLVKDRKRIKTLRARLDSISWYMKSVNEYIARKANKEDNCKGRFWEGRFKSKALVDEGAVFACAIYIDLNPIRAKVTTTPEQSEYTSAYERIKALGNHSEDSLWLSPLCDTKTRRGFLGVDTITYLEILEETGRIISEGKRGTISKKLKPILERLRLNTNNWNITSQHFGKWFSTVAGSVESIKLAAKELNKQWLKGKTQAKLAFI